jgi:hypothetical protein
MAKLAYTAPFILGIACAAADQYVSRKFGLVPNSLAAGLGGLGLGSLIALAAIHREENPRNRYERISGFRPPENYPIEVIKEALDFHDRAKESMSR